MKTIKLLLIGLAALGFAAVGCGETSDDPVFDGGGGDGDADGDADGDGDIDTSACESISITDAPTCALLIDAGREADCIADFGYYDSTLGSTSNQAGYTGNYSLGYVGFYGYNDVTEGADQLPVPNYYGSEAAEEIKSCDANNDSALHFYATGFEGWGAGVGLDWGGGADPANPACDEPGAIDCLQLRIDDDHTPLDIAEKAEVCQNADGTVNDNKIDCFKYGKIFNAPKDLSEYAGIGFWTLATEKNMKDKLKVAFPIPLSMRFYSEYYGDKMGYGDIYCDEDAGDDSKKCYNDYTTTIDLPVGTDDDVNKWVYHKILFGDLATSTIFGVQPATAIDASYASFPKDQSMGIKFQVDTWQRLMPDADFYIDDITLIK